MKIIGVGVSKTATSSLASALTHLGFPCVHSADPGRIELSAAMVDGQAAARYRELDIMYPQSKFILTVRDKDSWLESCRRHWMRTDLQTASPRVRFEFNWCRVKLFGRTTFDASNHWAAYQKHLSDVRNYFASRTDDLLTVDITAGDGWEPLCEFLGVEAPDIPFPCENVHSQ